MEATEEPRRSPPGQRSQIRSFVYLAWPALVAWGLTLVLVARPEGPSVVLFLFLLGVFLAVPAFGVIALVYAVLAAMAKVPTKVRMLACAANLASVAFPLLVVPSVHSLLAFSSEAIALGQCKALHDKAMIWKMIHRQPFNSLEEMVAPLRPEDEENFLDAVPDDPWGHPYVLEINGNVPRVRSFGPDGRKGTKDDIVFPGAD